MCIVHTYLAILTNEIRGSFGHNMHSKLPKFRITFQNLNNFLQVSIIFNVQIPIFRGSIASRFGFTSFRFGRLRFCWWPCYAKANQSPKQDQISHFKVKLLFSIEIFQVSIMMIFYFWFLLPQLPVCCRVPRRKCQIPSKLQIGNLELQFTQLLDDITYQKLSYFGIF